MVILESLGKLSSTRGNEFTGLMDSSAAQIENLDEDLRKKFKQLFIFHEIGVASHGVRFSQYFSRLDFYLQIF
jgi:hypothetical protein